VMPMRAIMATMNAADNFLRNENMAISLVAMIGNDAERDAQHHA
jgi:hypothetical protein